ncbi:sialic acid-binding Ig-like lectin 10 [Hemiscyllium ocellatum]|uniref:sialic acid-binding Ig-like lectin 10 n=1 Tax=Hemiscyllium ocellatum TaxID=170820 RepID=UPI002966CADE|nr:sialic acid-binding Ig-like lectin 10 [Hemiscyllium ocellatum]XP_060708575.1 sialic acid-binding Ig-like lectin 10 [Hemiscyllium ocellatum]XP_060708576.1 sialic acid-binding Ig-like lectin 10 [Hemiscyllium ocellatum]XP_060708577.1 sialic acid-binding Ig-like lectin 10 [Hemiscyllium ocellatum]
MIEGSYFLLFLLQAGLAQEWKSHSPRKVTAQKGSCAQIPCNYSYPSHLANQPRIGIWFYQTGSNQWSTAFHSQYRSYEATQFRNRTQLSGDLKDGDCSLIINNIKRGDSGFYYFRVEFNDTEKYRYKPATQLQVSAGPSQEWKGSTPREVIVQEGSCAQIPCRYNYPSCLKNQPRGGIWFNGETEKLRTHIAFHSKDPNHKSRGFRDRTQLSGDLKDGDCSLIINDIKREDAGPYFFKVKFDNGPSHHYYPVTQLRVSDFTDKPTIFPVQIIAGMHVRLRCTFNTTCIGTAPTLTWDTPTIVRGLVSNTITQHGVTLTYTSVLSLTPLLRHQGQSLTCRVSYSTVSSEQTFVLTVQYAPEDLTITSLNRMKDSSISTIKGESAVIICSVRSFPASNLMWRHLNAIMNRTSFSNELWLVIPNVTSREAGDYQCVAENEHGTVEDSLTITVEYAPENLTITSLDGIKNSSITITEGDSVLITCCVKSFPASNLMWKHLGVTMYSTSSHNELWLEIPHVTPRDTGDHRCVAQNEHGTMEGSLSITVQYPPQETTVSISGASGGIREGQNVTLTCSSESVPPISHYSWFRTEGTTSIQLNTSSQILSIAPVTRGNIAGFYCTVTNPLGNSSSNMTHLNVEYKPEISQESKCAERAEGITCVCAANSNPPANITWHLSHANLSGNQTHGGFMSEQLREGHLVKGFLILMGHQDEEEVVVFCSVQNPHGTSLFKAYQWLKGRNSKKWTLGLVVAGIVLSVFLAGILIFLCMRKRKPANKEAPSKTNDAVMIYSQISVKHKGSRNRILTDPQIPTRDTAGEIRQARQHVFGGPVGEAATHPDGTEDVVYANTNLSKLPCGDGTIQRGEETEYAEIRFQPQTEGKTGRNM